MDAETRALAVEKANNLVLNVGYPDAYENRSIIEDLYFEVVKLNKFYDEYQRLWHNVSCHKNWASTICNVIFQYNLSDSHLINKENVVKASYRYAASLLNEENDRERWAYAENTCTLSVLQAKFFTSCFLWSDIIFSGG